MSAASTTRTVGALVLWTSLVGPGWTEDVRLLDCAQVHFFGQACVPVTSTPPVPVTPTPPPAPLFSPRRWHQIRRRSCANCWRKPRWSMHRPFLTGSTGVRPVCKRCSSYYAG